MDDVAHQDVDMEAVGAGDMAVIVVVDSEHAITVRTAVEVVVAEVDARQDREEAVAGDTGVEEATVDTMEVGHQVETMAAVTEAVAAEEVVPTGGARTRD